MIKDYIVIDNALPEPDKVRDKLLSLTYYTKEDFTLTDLKIVNDDGNLPGGWRGFRTCNLFDLFKEESNLLLNGILEKVLDLPFEHRSSLHGHITTAKMNKVISRESLWHQDHTDMFAGVVYLSKTPKPGSGTWLKIKDKKIHVANKYNRMLFYKANVMHSPGKFFGSVAQNSRLTLTFFINGIKFEKKYLPVAQ